MNKQKFFSLSRATVLVLVVTGIIPLASFAEVGVNVTGSEYSWSTYPNVSHLDYLKLKGKVTQIRLPIAWEKLQSTVNGALNASEITKLKEFLTLAATRGISAIIDIHNYARYNPNWEADAAANWGIVAVSATSGLVLGTPQLPTSALQDLWGKLAGSLAQHPGVAGYGLMNEPSNIPKGLWKAAAQAVVNAIRSVDMSTRIYVGGDKWSSCYWWQSDNGNFFIHDPANNLIYEAHCYFDGDGSGRYLQTYDEQGAYPTYGVDRVQPFLNWLKANNLKGYIGEFGVPDNDPRWLTVLENFLKALEENGVSSSYWFYAYRDPSGANSWWPLSSGVDYYMGLNAIRNNPEKSQWNILRKFNNALSIDAPRNFRVTTAVAP